MKLQPLVLGISLLMPILTVAQTSIDFNRPPPTASTRTPVALASGVVNGGIEFTTWQPGITLDTVVGRIDSGLFCSVNSIGGEPLRYRKHQDDWIRGHVVRAYMDSAIRLGFTLPVASKSAFDDKAGSGASYRLGATLLSLDYRACGAGDMRGAAYAKVRWELYSTRQQQVIYTTEVEASFASEARMSEGDFDRKFAKAIVENLLGEPQFVEVVKTGVGPQGQAQAGFAPLEVAQTRVTSGSIAKGSAELLAAVATVESGTSSGSGFFVGSKGYLLTNRHVVGDAKFVRVKLAGGKSVVGEVVRTHRARDVALIQTDPVVDAVLPVRAGAVNVGEDVYALGSPFGDLLSGTVTRGIVSSRRVIEGTAFIQSDVAINPGNSGGPLVDASGQVVAISQLGSTAQGINLFIPIDEALDRLGLQLTPARDAKAGK